MLLSAVMMSQLLDRLVLHLPFFYFVLACSDQQHVASCSRVFVKRKVCCLLQNGEDSTEKKGCLKVTEQTSHL